MYIHIYIYMERERKRDVPSCNMYISMYLCVCLLVTMLTC